jgi:murein DD-endopeptidase MepM/ murein hydrolase activator NlpD
MKNVMGTVLLFLAGGILSGFISKTGSKITAKPFIEINNNPDTAGMVYPVAGKKSFVGSFWGAVRDGGKRKHEGIDIFARKGTPVVAVADGVVVEAGNTSRGGKTVWLRSFNDDFYYYYAHLNVQLVRSGQTVKKGQHLGTVGNTGNAKLTPPHLHFGIYSFTGAINPLPYVKNLPKMAIPAKTKRPSQALKAKNPVKKRIDA